MARTDYTVGENPTLCGPHVLTVLAGEAADELAAMIVPVVAAATSVSSVVDALSAESRYLDVDFIVVQFLGPLMIARVRGDRLAVTVVRRDGVEARFTAHGPGVVELGESSCVRVEIHDTASEADQAQAIPLPFGWEASSSVTYQSDATLTANEHEEWLENSSSAVRYEPPLVRGLEFADGRRLIVDRDVIIGRSPQVDSSADGEAPAVFAVDSPQRDISRTHLRISTDGSRVLLEDLHSTNGTEVTPEGGHPYLLEPGHPALLEDGAVVSLGDHVSFTVVTVE